MDWSTEGECPGGGFSLCRRAGDSMLYLSFDTKLTSICRRALSSKVATYNQRVVSEGDSLAQEVRTLHRHAAWCRHEVPVVIVVRSRLVQITELSKEIDVALQNSTEITVTEELQRARAIVQGHGPGGDLRKLCKQNSPFLLSLLLGKRTNVVTLQVWSQ